MKYFSKKNLKNIFSVAALIGLLSLAIITPTFAQNNLQKKGAKKFFGTDTFIHRIGSLSIDKNLKKPSFFKKGFGSNIGGSTHCINSKTLSDNSDLTGNQSCLSVGSGGVALFSNLLVQSPAFFLVNGGRTVIGSFDSKNKGLLPTNRFFVSDNKKIANESILVSALKTTEDEKEHKGKRKVCANADGSLSICSGCDPKVQDCKVPTDAVCKTFNTGFSEHPEKTVSKASLCISGTYYKLPNMARGNHDHYHAWMCVGSEGTKNAFCGAKLKMNGKCKNYPDSYTKQPANSYITGCSTYAGYTDLPDNSTHFKWQCAGRNNGSAEICSAKRAVAGKWSVGEWSKCSNSGQKTRTVTCPAGTTCSKPEPAKTASCLNAKCGTEKYTCVGKDVTLQKLADQGGKNKWNCLGVTGGDNKVCTKAIPQAAIDGVCGTANGETLDTAPTTKAELCSVGNPSTKGAWSWTCSAEHGGTAASCSATETVKETYKWVEGGWGECSVASAGKCSGNYTVSSGSASCQPNLNLVNSSQTVTPIMCAGQDQQSCGTNLCYGNDGNCVYCEATGNCSTNPSCRWVSGDSSTKSCSGSNISTCLASGPIGKCTWTNAGKSTRTRTVKCVDSKGNDAPGKCDESKKPATEQVCGVCGPAHGKTFSSSRRISRVKGERCKSAVTGYEVPSIATSGNTYSWTCKGAEPAINANCRAEKKSNDPICSETLGDCIVGSSAQKVVDEDGTGVQYEYTCSNAGKTVTCGTEYQAYEYCACGTKRIPLNSGETEEQCIQRAQKNGECV